MANNNSISCAIDSDGKIIENQDFNKLNSKQQLQLRNYVSDFMGAQENVIQSIVDSTKTANS